MATQTFIPREYSLREQDLLPPDELEEPTGAWQAFCQSARGVDHDAVKAVVLERLGEVAELDTLIAEAIRDPHDNPDEPRIPVYQAMRLVKEVARLVAHAVVEQVTMQQACSKE